MTSYTRTQSALLMIACVAWLAAPHASKAAEPAGLPEDFSDHLQRVEGGRVDWSGGFILAEGIGHPNGREESVEQAQKMAERAAEVTAARNALAIAKGIRLSATGTLGGVRDATVRLEGVIRGHRVTESKWDPNANPPTARVVLRVPLWGVRGVGAIFGSSYRASAIRRTVRRVVLHKQVVPVAEYVVVLDARGLKLSQCLFPDVLSRDGEVIYDIVTPPADYVGRRPMVRYVETRVRFEQLQSRAVFEPIWRTVPAQYGAASSAPAKTPASEPATQPARRRARQRMVIRVAEVSGEQKTQLVLTREDAQRLRESAEASSALKNAQVLIVVDTAAAGGEGRGPRPAAEDVLAFEPETPEALAAWLDVRP